MVPNLRNAMSDDKLRPTAEATSNIQDPVAWRRFEVRPTANHRIGGRRLIPFRAGMTAKLPSYRARS
jgi:hypothetical protein